MYAWVSGNHGECPSMSLQQPSLLTCLLLGCLPWKCSPVSALAEVEELYRNSAVLYGFVFLASTICGTSLTQGCSVSVFFPKQILTL